MSVVATLKLASQIDLIKMIKLSYSSLNNLHNGHEWLNKQMGIPVPDYDFLKEGTEAHRLIQDHVSGKTKHKSLSHIEINFPIVEEISDEKDPGYWNAKEKCKFSRLVGDKYEIYGYVDGLDVKNKRFLEIKSSSSPWSMVKFRDAMQRKLYAWALSDYQEAYLITGKKDPALWEKEPPKLYSMKITKQDIQEAKEWIEEGIMILESGNFKKGLDEEGFCEGCFWNMARYPQLANCNFIRR